MRNARIVLKYHHKYTQYPNSIPVPIFALQPPTPPIPNSPKNTQCRHPAPILRHASPWCINIRGSVFSELALPVVAGLVLILATYAPIGPVLVAAGPCHVDAAEQFGGDWGGEKDDCVEDSGSGGEHGGGSVVVSDGMGR
jgi:hypothetical protein